MAVGRHNPSRRALLGAALALPLVGRGNAGAAEARGPLHQPPAGPPPRPGEDLVWRRALGAVERAGAEVRAVERRSAGAPHAEQLALETVYGDRLDDLYAAIRRLIRTPSPDLAALATKIVFTVDHDIVELNGGAVCMEALKGDALRLAAVRGTQELSRKI